MDRRPQPFRFIGAGKGQLIEKLSSAITARAARGRRTIAISKEANSAGRLDVSELEGFREIRMIREAAEFLGIADPFFRVHEGIAAAETVIGEQPLHQLRLLQLYRS